MDTKRTVSLYRWYFMLALWLVGLGMGTWYLVMPLARGRVAGFRELRADLAFFDRAETLPREIEGLRREALLLDSLLASVDNRKPFDEAQVVEEVYTLADSAGCGVSKVEIGEPIRVSSAVEIPITLNAKGSYESIGKLTDGVENSGYATRVRQMLLNKSGEDEGSLYLDFVVMEGRWR